MENILSVPPEERRKGGICGGGIPPEEKVRRKKGGKLALFWEKLSNFRFEIFYFLHFHIKENIS